MTKKSGKSNIAANKKNSIKKLTLSNNPRKAIEGEKNSAKNLRIPKQTAQKPPTMTRPRREDQSSMEVVVVTRSQMVAVATIQRRMSHKLSSKRRLQAVQSVRKLPSVLRAGKPVSIDDSERF